MSKNLATWGAFPNSKEKISHNKQSQTNCLENAEKCETKVRSHDHTVCSYR